MLSDWNRKEFWNLVAVVWAAALVAGAQILELGFGQEPCALCVNQRMWAMLAGLICVAGFAHNPRLGIYPLLTALASMGGAAFSIRHLYLLTLPADQVPGCGVGLEYMLDVFPLMDILQQMTMGTGECAEQSVVIPALALAGFVVMIALAVTYWRSRA